MNKMRICSRLVIAGIALGLVLAGCKDPKSNKAEITALTLTIASQDYTIDFTGMTAKVVLPEGTTIPDTASVQAVTLSPGASGLAQDDPVSINASGEASITITAEDGTTTQDYTVTVKVKEPLSNYSLSYPVAKHSADGSISASPIWKKGTATEALDSGGVSYGIAPALPSGLTLDSANGTISGTISTMLSLEDVSKYQITATGNNIDYRGSTTGIFLDKFLLSEYSQVTPASGSAISNLPELKAMVTAVSSDPSGEYYLTAHIDLTSAAWTPIASSTTPFTGKLHGNGYAIYNLTINAEAATHQGLFASVSGATIENLSIGVTSIKGKMAVGALAGFASNATLSNIAVVPMTADAKIKAIGTAVIGGQDGSHVGGLVGYQKGGSLTGYSRQVTVEGAGGHVGGLVGSLINGTVSGYATGDVTGTNISVGGLVGYNNEGSASGYATGAVTGTGENNSVGGLVGLNFGYDSTTIGYATGDVRGKNFVAGLVGGNANGSVTGYATGDVSGDQVGGLTTGGHQSGDYSGYWDKQSTGQDTTSTGSVVAGATTVVGISATKNIVFTADTGYTDSENRNTIFDNTDFAAVFDTANGADKTWPKLKSSYTYKGTDYNFDFPQPTVTVSASDENIIEVAY